MVSFSRCDEIREELVGCKILGPECCHRIALEIIVRIRTDLPEYQRS
jgi:hypothetical protein